MIARQGHQNPFRVMTDYVYNGNLSDVFDFPSQFYMVLSRYFPSSFRSASLFCFARIFWSPFSFVSCVLGSSDLGWESVEAGDDNQTGTSEPSNGYDRPSL